MQRTLRWRFSCMSGARGAWALIWIVMAGPNLTPFLLMTG